MNNANGLSISTGSERITCLRWSYSNVIDVFYDSGTKWEILLNPLTLYNYLIIYMVYFMKVLKTLISCTLLLLNQIRFLYLHFKSQPSKADLFLNFILQLLQFCMYRIFLSFDFPSSHVIRLIQDAFSKFEWNHTFQSLFSFILFIFCETNQSKYLIFIISHLREYHPKNFYEHEFFLSWNMQT